MVAAEHPMAFMLPSVSLSEAGSETDSAMSCYRYIRVGQQTLHDESWQRHLVCLSVISEKMFETKERYVGANHASRILVSGQEGEIQSKILQKHKSSF